MRKQTQPFLFVVLASLVAAAVYFGFIAPSPHKARGTGEIRPTAVLPHSRPSATEDSLRVQLERERLRRVEAEGRVGAVQSEMQRVIEAQAARMAMERQARRRSEAAQANATREVDALRGRLADRATATESIAPLLAIAPPPPAAPSPAAVPPAPAESLTPEEVECAPGHPCQVKVFFATDRKQADRAHTPAQYRYLKTYYGGNRELDANAGLTLGTCLVTIPKPHYRKFAGKLDYAGTYDADTSVFIREVTPAGSTEAWIASLNQRIEADTRGREMFVFIHGFNVTFADAARRTAQIYYDLGFKGAPVFYSWPSGGNIWNYWADEASVEWSAKHLREFLDLIAERSHARKIHLIAHSMGNRALTRALAEIGARNAPNMPAECRRESTPFREVILAAPDLDTDLFLQLQAGIKSSASRVTLYASKRDRAMLASWILHRFRRLGFPSGKTPPPGVDAIDATSASSDILGHSYYGESVLEDMKLMFDEPDVAIEKRCTVKRSDAAAYYRFLPQPLGASPGRLTRAVKFVFRKREPQVIIGCKTPGSAAVASN